MNLPDPDQNSDHDVTIHKDDDNYFAVSLLDIQPLPGTSEMRVSTEGNLVRMMIMMMMTMTRVLMMMRVFPEGKLVRMMKMP